MDKNSVEAAIANTNWDAGNRILYKLCQEYPSNTADDVIIAKVWLIGRAYSAAIERRTKYLGVKVDSFYEDRVAPAMRQAKIDEWLADVRDDPTGAPVLRAHARLTKVFEEITGREKRSLASKYLHFHRPQAFFIYDSRAQAAIVKLVPGRRVPANRPSECDRLR